MVETRRRFCSATTSIRFFLFLETIALISCVLILWFIWRTLDPRFWFVALVDEPPDLFHQSREYRRWRFVFFYHLPTIVVIYHISPPVRREDVITLFTKLIGELIFSLRFTPVLSSIYMQVEFAKPSVDFTQHLAAISNSLSILLNSLRAYLSQDDMLSVNVTTNKPRSQEITLFVWLHFFRKTSVSYQK